jgi:hypothetical protein
MYRRRHLLPVDVGGCIASELSITFGDVSSQAGSNLPGGNSSEPYIGCLSYWITLNPEDSGVAGITGPNSIHFSQLVEFPTIAAGTAGLNLYIATGAVVFPDEIPTGYSLTTTVGDVNRAQVFPHGKYQITALWNPSAGIGCASDGGLSPSMGYNLAVPPVLDGGNLETVVAEFEPPCVGEYFVGFFRMPTVPISDWSANSTVSP